MKKPRIILRRDFSKEIKWPPDEFFFEWAVGKFLLLFQELELYICAWIAKHMNITLEDVVILTKDSNFNQKIGLVRRLFSEPEKRKSSLKHLLSSMRELNDLRNLIAHGLILHQDGELYLIMPSRDFLSVEKKHAFNNEILGNAIIKAENTLRFFTLDKIAIGLGRSPTKNNDSKQD